MVTRTVRLLILAFGVGAIATALVAFLLISVFSRQQEAKLSYFKVTDIPTQEPNPEVWGQNFPLQYETWKNTLISVPFAEYSKIGRYGGSDNYQKLDVHPALRRFFAGYPFSVDYREERGHANALKDMLDTKRLGDAKPGSCMTCKSPQVPLIMNKIGAEQFYATPVKDLVANYDIKYSISCGDCHDSQTMALQVTRPAFKEAMASRGIDVSKASRQEMRLYVCGQCHVEYFFRGQNKTVVYPWAKGLTIDNIEAFYEEIKFSDWTHDETKAPMIKVQHPEFELFSTGVHASSGVSCPDCHMPYTRNGAVKTSSHWVNSPLEHLNTSCLTCHRQTEAEMRKRVLDIQDRTYAQMQRSEDALLQAMDAIAEAMKAGVSDDRLAEARNLHRRAQLRWDFVSAENSMGFHSPQEAVRILGEAADFARQAQMSAYKARSGTVALGSVQ